MDNLLTGVIFHTEGEWTFITGDIDAHRKLLSKFGGKDMCDFWIMTTSNFEELRSTILNISKVDMDKNDMNKKEIDKKDKSTRPYPLVKQNKQYKLSLPKNLTYQPHPTRQEINIIKPVVGQLVTIEYLDDDTELYVIDSVSNDNLSCFLTLKSDGFVGKQVKILFNQQTQSWVSSYPNTIVVFHHCNN